MFHGSIYENLTLGEDIPLERIKQAAQEIEVDEFIERLPGGYDYVVSERGSSISLGQRQLLSFLRAYLTNPSILILDEATSSIDLRNPKTGFRRQMEKITKKQNFYYYSTQDFSKPL